MTDFFQKFSFTPTERKVVLTLVGAFLVGLAIRFFAPSGGEVSDFDYAASDSIFAARSAAATASVPAPARGRDTAAARPSVGPVRINSAGKTELMSLPGVGETIAERIIRYREDHGRFATVRELLKVKGIGEKKFERLASLCVVED
jgi:competence protein ComEA